MNQLRKFSVFFLLKVESHIRLSRPGSGWSQCHLKMSWSRVNPRNGSSTTPRLCTGPGFSKTLSAGANFVEQRGTGLKKFLKFGNRQKIAQELRVGFDCRPRLLISFIQ